MKKFLLLLISICMFYSGCGPDLQGKGDNVIVITFDTVRADHFGCYGMGEAHTPNVDQLAKEGVLFEQCISPVPITLPSHTSILTARYPCHHGVRNNGNYFVPDEELTMAEVFQQAGYETAAFVSAYVLHSLFGLDQGFQTYDDTVRDSEAVVSVEERNAKETADAAIRWLSEKHRRPFFLWVHFFDPHHAHRPPQEWADQFPEDLYLGEIAFADHEMGRVLQAAAENDGDRETVVVFAGDHGEAFGQHGERTHAYFTYDATLHVPLIVKLPGSDQGGTRISHQASLVDIMPTVLGYLDIDVPDSKWDGVDLFRLKKDRAAYFESIYPFVFEWAPLAGLRTVQWKYIQAPKPELFDISQDSDELNNKVENQQEAAERLLRKLQALKPFEGLQEAATQRELSAEERRTLASLGYVGSSAGQAKRDLSTLPDPKDTLKYYLKYMDAGSASRAGAYGEAEKHLRDLLQTYPDLAQAQMLLGEVLREAGRFDESIRVLAALIEKRPEDSAGWYSLAVSCNKGGKPDQAIQICQDGIKIFPEEAGLFDQLGLAYQIKGKLPEAIENGRRAIEIIEDKPEYLNNYGASLSAAGKLEEAKTVLKKALKIQPDFSQSLHNIGIVFLRKKNYSEAENNFRKAFDADPENFDSLIQLNKALLYQGKSDEALEVSHRLNTMVDDPEISYFMSVAYRQKQQYIEAERYLRDFISSKPDFPPAYVELADVLLSQKPRKLDQAREFLKKAENMGEEIPMNIRNKAQE